MNLGLIDSLKKNKSGYILKKEEMSKIIWSSPLGFKPSKWVQYFDGFIFTLLFFYVRDEERRLKAGKLRVTQQLQRVSIEPCEAVA